jgi:hypothetical protein
MVPFMLAWIPQTYVNVPAVANVRVYDAPVPSVSLVAVPSSHLTLCPAESWFVQVTVVPAFTVRLAGANAKFAIVTALPAAAGALAAALGAAALAAGLAGGGVGVAEPPHAARATLAEKARPMRRGRRIGFPSDSMRGGSRQPGARPLTRITGVDTPAHRWPVSEGPR